MTGSPTKWAALDTLKNWIGDRLEGRVADITSVGGTANDITGSVSWGAANADLTGRLFMVESNVQ